MSAVFKGTDVPQLTRRQYSFSKKNGWSTTETYEGERKNVLQLAGRFHRLVDSLDVSTDGPTATMTTRVARDTTAPTTPNSDGLTTTWELMGQTVSRDIADNPKAATIQEFRDIAHIKAQAKKIVDPNASHTAANAIATSLPSGASWSNIHKVLLIKYSLGQENSQTTEWVLRKSQVVHTDYELELATAGIDMIWSTKKLFGGETDVPKALLKSVGNISKNDVTAFGASGDVLQGSGYKWKYGWLKQAPSMTYTTGGMVERSQEWWLNYWFTFDYPLYG